MNPQSEVVLRQTDHLNGHVLLINAPQDSLVSELNNTVQSSIWTWNYTEHQAHSSAEYNSFFGVDFPQGEFDQVIIFVPKSKELLTYLLYQVASHLPQNKDIFLVGEKKGGVERASKQLKVHGQITKLDSARHCQMWHAKLEQQLPKKPLESWLKTYDIQVQNETLHICALPGVFSQDHLDIGTSVLLPFLTQVKSGKIADFGCGAGVIGLSLAKINPENTIYALDVDAFALKSTELTFKKNHINPEQLVLTAITGIQDVPIGLKVLISNPPFHQGIHTSYNVSEDLCQEARKHLTMSGEIWLVANRFLSYPTLLEKTFGKCHIKADQKGFKVLYASSKKGI